MTAPISITELGRIIEAGIEPERSFGWDAVYGPGAMFVPDIAEPETGRCCKLIERRRYARGAQLPSPAPGLEVECDALARRIEALRHDPYQARLEFAIAGAIDWFLNFNLLAVTLLLIAAYT